VMMLCIKVDENNHALQLTWQCRPTESKSESLGVKTFRWMLKPTVYNCPQKLRL
jgi:hypothetical protein